MVSPLYLYHLNDDPILFCFCLMERLREWRKGGFFADGYSSSFQSICNRINRSLTIVLQAANTDYETTMLLTHPMDGALADQVLLDHSVLGRVQVLLDLGMKKPATCDTVQGFVNRMYGHGVQWLPHNTIAQTLVVLSCYLLLTPIMILWPHSHLKHLFCSPRFAALLDTTSIVLYIGLALISAGISDQPLDILLCSGYHTLSNVVNSALLAFLVGR